MRTPAFWYKNTSIITFTLIPLSYLWILLSLLKNSFRKKHNFNVPIICVGNLIAGGGGKTPLVIEICKYYKKKKSESSCSIQSL